MHLVPFAPAHLMQLAPGVSDLALLGGFDLARCAASWPAGPALSLMDQGRVLGCAGLMALGDDAVAWAVLSDELRGRRFTLHRTAWRNLDRLAAKFTRVSATVADDFAAGHRWLRRLGFRPVRRLPGYGPKGETFMEYQR